MPKKYEVWLSVFDHKTYESREVKAKRTFDSLDKANAYADDIKRPWTWGVTDCNDKLINTKDIFYIRIREVWY